MKNTKKSIRRLFTGLIAIVLCLSLAGCTVEMPEKGTMDPLEDNETVRIMSFNIRFGEYSKRKEIVPGVIDAYLPDSAGLQECTYQWYNNIIESLPDYGFVGVGRDTGNLESDCGEISAILYRTDKYNLIDSGTFWISETPDEVSRGWDAACNRVCTWAILENKETGEQYAHVNTHLDHVDDVARENGAKMVSEFALKFDMPTVVTGDFNFKKGCDWYNIVVNAGLTDTQDIADDTMYGRTYHAYSGAEDGDPIDFIFTNDKVEKVYTYKIIREKYGNRHISDHYPIYADMKF